MEAAVILPGFHTYTFPPGDPEAERVVLLPLQIVADGFALIVKVGIGLTVIVEVPVEEHPVELLAVRVYPLEAVGETIIVDAVPPGALHE